ncbi:MAG: hypothetical protein LBF92_10420 [Synergistaceae bacterium]|nr:hypothetical protein [Synergistaceae bacterium]
MTSSSELMAQGASDLTALSDDMKATFEAFTLEDGSNTRKSRETPKSRQSLPSGLGTCR